MSGFTGTRHLTGLLTLTARLAGDMIAADLERLGITYAQAVAMVRLWRAGGSMRQGDLVEALALSRPSGTLVLRELEERALVERHRDPSDGRRHIVVLTDRGRKLEGPVLEIFEAAEAKITAGVGAADLPAAFAALRIVLANLRRERAGNGG